MRVMQEDCASNRMKDYILSFIHTSSFFKFKSYKMVESQLFLLFPSVINELIIACYQSHSSKQSQNLFFFMIINLLQLTMSTKTKIKLQNHTKYQFQHLLRHYQQAIELTKSGECLQSPDIFRVLDSMGYLCNQKTEKDYELISSLTHMLAHPKGHGIVSQRNLFKLLVIINHLQGNVDNYFERQVQPLPKDIGQLQTPLIQIQIGEFDKDGYWSVTKQEQKQLRQIFSNMIYTRVSRHDINTNKKKQNEIEGTENFKPKILNKSVIMAQNRLKKLNMEGRVEDRLLQGRDEFNNRIYVEIKASLQKQLKDCSFKPRINSRSKHHQKSHSFSQQEILLQKGREYQLRRKMYQEEYEQFKQSLQLSHCSFHPDLSSSTSSLRHSLRRQFNPRVKNQEKSIQRMKMAREEREVLNQINRRGYPQGKSWVNFMEELRTKRCNTSTYHDTSISSENKPIIFTMDLKILGQNKHIEVKQADDILEMTHRICQNRKFNEENYRKVYEIIQKTLRQSGEAIIKNGKVFLLKRK